MTQDHQAEESFVPYPAGKMPAKDLARLLARYRQKDPRVVVGPGIGKDATVLSFGDRYLVAKADPITLATEEIGRYVVQINANDVACVGGIPRWFLATLLLPEGDTGYPQVEKIFAQISEACEEIGVVLCGGHTEITLGLDRPMVIGQMLGEVEKGKLILTERVVPDDEIILTKGIAIEGTALIARERKELATLLSKDLIDRCRNFLKNPGISILKEARIANQVAEIHAMHDPTEGGLATGLYELSAAASAGLMVEMEKISVFPETAILCQELQLDPLGLIASGALLIVTDARNSGKIRAALEKEGIFSAVIGKVWEREKGVKLFHQGKFRDLPIFPRDEIARLFERGEE